jgi:hypothetical protein
MFNPALIFLSAVFVVSQAPIRLLSIISPADHDLIVDPADAGLHASAAFRCLITCTDLAVIEHIFIPYTGG